MSRKIRPTVAVDFSTDGITWQRQDLPISLTPNDNLGAAYVGYDFKHRQPVHRIAMIVDNISPPRNIKVECSHDGRHWGRNGRQATWKVRGKEFNKVKYYRHKATAAARYWRVRGLIPPTSILEVSMYGKG